MIDHFVDIYANEGARYQQLIAAEDVQGNLVQALERITDFKGKRVLDLGSGTGRIPALLKDADCQIVAVELYGDMLREQKRLQSEGSLTSKQVQADMRWLPLARGWADVVTAGWAIGHFTGWYGEDWQCQASRALGEMARVTRPGGTLIIMETMGTGTEQTAPPNPALAEYYAWLEELGFARQVVSTDYDFGSVERAAELCGFFFGEEMRAKVRERGWSRVPEWTGVWHKEIS